MIQPKKSRLDNTSRTDLKMSDATLCEEKLRLLTEFREATTSFSACVADIADIAGSDADACGRIRGAE